MRRADFGGDNGTRREMEEEQDRRKAAERLLKVHPPSVPTSDGIAICGTKGTIDPIVLCDRIRGRTVA